WGAPLATLRSLTSRQIVKSGNLRVKVSADPIAFTIESEKGATIQEMKLDKETGVFSFTTGHAPLLGLGEGGPQFDRRGSTDRMVSGQGGYKLPTHGGRVPIPWLIGTSGWAMYFHQPFGTFDFTGTESKFLPVSPDAALPLDIFFVAASEPAMIMAEYARLTGYAEMPRLWSLGYQRSHATLPSAQAINDDANRSAGEK